MSRHEDGRARLGTVKSRDYVLNVSAVAVFITSETRLNRGIVAEILQRLDDAAADDVILLGAAGMWNAVPDKNAKNIAGALGGKFSSRSACRLGSGRPRGVKQHEENRGEQTDYEERTSCGPLIFLRQPSLRVGDTIGCEFAQVNKTAGLWPQEVAKGLFTGATNCGGTGLDCVARAGL